ncbi:MAG: hypothetical protein AAGI34_19240 [Pseudomonadota bacterium]
MDATPRFALPPVGALAHVWLVPAALIAGERLIDLGGDIGPLQLVILGAMMLGVPLLAGWTASRLSLTTVSTLVVAGLGIAIYWAIALWRVTAAGPEAAGWLPLVVALGAGQVSVACSTAWAMLKLQKEAEGTAPTAPQAGKSPKPRRPVAKGPRRKGKG